ncbi:MAG: OmpA family protein [bacterium]|nr:OmpA family protein [bacterium]
MALAITCTSAVGAAPFLGLNGQALRQGIDPLVTNVQARLLPPAVRKVLRNRGFGNINVRNEHGPIVSLTACKGGRLYVLALRRDGRIVKNLRRGKCPQSAAAVPGVNTRAVTPAGVSPKQIKRELRSTGFSNITIVNRNPPGYTVRACKNGKHFQLSIHRQGHVVKRNRIGRCDGGSNAGGGGSNAGGGGLTPPQIRKNLKDRGFEEIRFLDRDLPVYVVTACKGNKRFRMRMNRWAAVSKKTRDGRCGFDRSKRKPPVNDNSKRPPEIRKLLQGRGFNQITFTDRRLPIYVVRACEKGRRMELRIDASGLIRKRKRIGRCQVTNNGLRPPQIRKVLQTRGFSRILFTDHQLPTYVVEACRHDRKFELRLNRFGRVNRKTKIGRCREQQAERGFEPREVKDILRRRGYREINFFDRRLPGYGVEACRRGQKFRMRINRFAEIRKRRRAGFCRPPAKAPVIQYEYEEIDEEQISGTEQIDPETCQSYLDALVHRNRIHFDVASASLRRGSYSLLTRLSRVMNRCPSSRIEISGHTDSDGSREYNLDLSRRRAKTVAGFLAQEGISLRRMTAFGYGEDQPLMRYEETQRDKARNRRIDFTVIWGDDDEDDDDYRRKRR